MRVAQIGPYPIDEKCIKGGIEASVHGLSRELAIDNEVYVFDFPRYTNFKNVIENKESVTVYRYPARKKSNYWALFKIFRITKDIKTVKPEICHVHSTGLFYLLLYLYLNYLNFPTIVTVHGLAHVEKKNQWKSKPSLINLIKYYGQSLTEFVFLSFCPKVIVDTHYVKKVIEDCFVKKKILKMPVCIIIPQGIDSRYYSLNKQPAPCQLLSVGTFSSRKGHLNLIASMCRIKEAFPYFRLTIVGSLSNEAYYGEMQKKVYDNNLQDNITIIPDVGIDELFLLYERSEIFVLHSQEESQGIVFCEAMAAGKPIVATNVGGISCIIKEGINGLLANYGDVYFFAKNIIRLIEDSILKNEIISNNLRQSEKYNWKFVKSEVIQVYQAITH